MSDEALFCCSAIWLFTLGHPAYAAVALVCMFISSLGAGP
jgi:hypothetical protein